MSDSLHPGSDRAPRITRPLFWWPAVAAAALVAGCTATPPPTMPQAEPRLETILVPLPENLEVSPPEPIAPSLINQSKAEDLWHLRSALNVAALICDPQRYNSLAPSYNEILRTHRDLLTTAVESELDQFRKQSRRSWQALYDTHMTKVYNGYSITTGREKFCATATDVAGDAVGLDTEALTDRSTRLLFRLNRAAGMP